MQQLHKFRLLLQVQRDKTAKTVRDQFPISRRRFGRDRQGDLSKPLPVVLALLVVESLDRSQQAQRWAAAEFPTSTARIREIVPAATFAASGESLPFRLVALPSSTSNADFSKSGQQATTKTSGL